jgi:hypothetical protein
MPTFEVTFTVPKGTTVAITGLEAGATLGSPEVSLEDAVQDYWRHYLSDNARKIYASAARIEDVHGPGYTLEDIAQNLSLDYESVRSLHRTSGRTAKTWQAEKRVAPPIRLEAMEYPETESGTHRRTRYRLPPGVAEIVEDLPLVGGRGGDE